MKTTRILQPILFAIVGGLIVVLFTHFQPDKKVSVSSLDSSTKAIPVNLAAFTTSTGEISDFTFSAEKSIDGVVHVKTKATRSQPEYYFGNPLLEYFFGPNLRQQAPQEVMGSGSGVIISTDGYIITNNHVIDNADNIEVVLNDRRAFDAKVVGRDPNTDIAVLKIEAQELAFIPFGNSEEIRVGEWVLAIGNPFNLNSTVTAGIVSAKARGIGIIGDLGIESFIQTDAAVNPGNSGGALVNLKGELVGINTAIASKTGSFSGYSFAIPTTIAKKVAMDIIEYGEVQRALLGVQIADLTTELAKEKNIKDLKGVYIGGVAKDGAAESIGLKEGDVILEINGVEVNTASQLQEQISKYRPNDKIKILVNRDNKKKPYEVVLRNMKGGFDIVRPNEILNVLGAEFKEIDINLKRKLGLKQGLQITKLKDGELKKRGIEEGFIITRVNRNNVTTVQELHQLLSTLTGAVLIEGVYPNGLAAYYAIGL